MKNKSRLATERVTLQNKEKNESPDRLIYLEREGDRDTAKEREIEESQSGDRFIDGWRVRREQILFLSIFLCSGERLVELDHSILFLPENKPLSRLPFSSFYLSVIILSPYIYIYFNQEERYLTLLIIRSHSRERRMKKLLCHHVSSIGEESFFLSLSLSLAGSSFSFCMNRAVGVHRQILFTIYFVTLLSFFHVDDEKDVNKMNFSLSLSFLD